MVRREHNLNALSPILVTLEGIATEVSLAHPLNALLPILVTLEGMEMEVSFLHSQNILSTILVTPVEMETEVRFLLKKYLQLIVYQLVLVKTVEKMATLILQKAE